jgi:hypothetical protein
MVRRPEHGHRGAMAGRSRTHLRYAVSSLALVSGVALIVADQAAGVAWGLIVLALGIAAGGVDLGADAPAARSSSAPKRRRRA